jgi:hypothetical protein
MNMEESNCVVVNRSMSAKNHWRSTTTGRFRHIGMVLAGLVCTSGILVVSPSLASASSKPTPACTILSNSTAGQKFDAQIAADEKSKNTGAMKTLFVNLVTDIEKLSSPMPAALKSLPASEQSAIKTIGHAAPQLKTALEKATTETELIAAFGVWGKIAGVAAAENTLNHYVATVCQR